MENLREEAWKAKSIRIQRDLDEYCEQLEQEALKREYEEEPIFSKVLRNVNQ